MPKCKTVNNLTSLSIDFTRLVVFVQHGHTSYEPFVAHDEKETNRCTAHFLLLLLSK